MHRVRETKSMIRSAQRLGGRVKEAHRLLATTRNIDQSNGPALGDFSTDTPSFKLEAGHPACPSVNFPTFGLRKPEETCPRYSVSMRPVLAYQCHKLIRLERANIKPGYTRLEGIVLDFRTVTGGGSALECANPPAVRVAYCWISNCACRYQWRSLTSRPRRMDTPAANKRRSGFTTDWISGASQWEYVVQNREACGPNPFLTLGVMS